MKTTAEVVCSWVRSPIGSDRILQYEWVGPVHGIARVGPEYLPFIPWPYEVLSQEHLGWSTYICRTDYPFPWPLACNRLAAEADRFARQWQWFQSRLIYTAMVWGLAYVEPGSIPNWGCIGKSSWRN